MYCCSLRYQNLERPRRVHYQDHVREHEWSGVVPRHLASDGFDELAHVLKSRVDHEFRRDQTTDINRSKSTTALQNDFRLTI